MAIPLSQPPEFWDYRQVLPCLGRVGILEPGEVSQWLRSSTANIVRTEALGSDPSTYTRALQLSGSSAPSNLMSFSGLTCKHTQLKVKSLLKRKMELRADIVVLEI